MQPAMYSGKQRLDAIAIANRGLNYGDGLFETMRVHRCELPLWPRHLARLRMGAQRLGIRMPDPAFIEAQIGDSLFEADQGVLKLLLTRGDGGRGYAPPVDADPVWMLSLHPLPVASSQLRLGWCDTRLAIQPALAGIKHCNRLEQVLARAEMQRAGCDEGLMCDGEGRVVSATAGNLLFLQGGRWRTPKLDRCGVAGVLRGWLLEQGLVEEADVSMDTVEAAESLAICNAVRGILRVSELGARTIPATAAGKALQLALAEAYPMFTDSVETA